MNKRRRSDSAILVSVVLLTVGAPALASDGGAGGGPAAGAGTPVAAAGASPRPRLERPWLIRSELNLSGKGGLGEDTNDASSVALTVGRNFTERTALELTYGDDRPLAYSEETRWGWTAMANFRWAPWLSANGRHAWTLAGGPFLLAGGPNGTVPFAHAEAAYEYRAAFGLSVLAGLGGNLALSDGRAIPPSSGICWLGCRVAYQAGDRLLHARLGLGYSF